MPPSNAMENDKKRLRNQFTKDERTRLLAIMGEYGPLLDDKNISILSRKEIWEIIENKFNENGHSGRTSAQLKKYWQNYKYHSKRAKITHKETPKTMSPTTRKMVKMLAKVNPEEWAQYDVKVNVASKKQPAESPKPSPSLATYSSPLFCSGLNTAVSERREEDYSPIIRKLNVPPQRHFKSFAAEPFSSAHEPTIISRCEGVCVKDKNKISESDLRVSTTDGQDQGSSVTVSVICPEVPSQIRSIFRKRNMPLEKDGSNFGSSYANEKERVTERRNSPDGFRHVGRPIRQTNGNDSLVVNDAHRHGIIGMFEASKPERLALNRLNFFERRCGGYDQPPAVGEPLDQYAAISRQIASEKQMLINTIEATTNMENKYDFVRNLQTDCEIVDETPTAMGDLSRDCHSMDKFCTPSAINEGNDTRIVGMAASADTVSSRSSVKKSPARQVVRNLNNDTEDIDYSELNELLQQLANVRSFKRTEILDDIRQLTESFGLDGSVHSGVDTRESSIPFISEKSEPDDMKNTANCKDLGTRDFLRLKLYLRLLRSVGQPGSRWYLDMLQTIQPLLSTANGSIDKRNTGKDESNDSDQTRGEQGRTVDDYRRNAANRVDNLRVRRVSSMTLAAVDDEVQREIKVESSEEEQETPPVTSANNTEESRVVNSISFLVKAKLQCAKLELDHQLKLQELEMEEKTLKVKIAEMTVHETKLRIQALIEERLRGRELDELRLAQMNAEKTRSEVEHVARLAALGATGSKDPASNESDAGDCKCCRHLYKSNCNGVRYKQHQHQ